MRHLRLAILVLALSACVGASDCSGSSGSSKKGSPDSGTGVIDPPGSEGSGPVVPTPEPGGALLFGVGALIAAVATRRLEKRRA